MATDGYIIKVDYTEVKRLAPAVNKVSDNINHICLCRRINNTGHFYADGIVDLKKANAADLDFAQRTTKE